jgi:hypothetical protein
LLPEGVPPRERPIDDHPVVAAPHRVHQDVDRAGVRQHLRERAFDLLVVSVVAADGADAFPDDLAVRR